MTLHIQVSSSATQCIYFNNNIVSIYTRESVNLYQVSPCTIQKIFRCKINKKTPSKSYVQICGTFFRITRFSEITYTRTIGMDLHSIIALHKIILNDHYSNIYIYIFLYPSEYQDISILEHSLFETIIVEFYIF